MSSIWDTSLQSRIVHMPSATIQCARSDSQVPTAPCTVFENTRRDLCAPGLVVNTHAVDLAFGRSAVRSCSRDSASSDGLSLLRRDGNYIPASSGSWEIFIRLESLENADWDTHFFKQVVRTPIADGMMITQRWISSFHVEEHRLKSNSDVVSTPFLVMASLAWRHGVPFHPCFLQWI